MKTCPACGLNPVSKDGGATCPNGHSWAAADNIPVDATVADFPQFYVYATPIPLGASGWESRSAWYGPMTRELADRHAAATEDIRQGGMYADVRPASAETLRFVREWVAAGGTLTALTAWGETGRVRMDGDGNPVVVMATDGQCGRSWNDALMTSLTPVPSARCPFEYDHVYDDES